MAQGQYRSRGDESMSDLSHRFSRRRLLAGLAALPAAFVLACSSSSKKLPTQLTERVVPMPELPPTATPTPTPEPPFVVAPGEERRLLMAGTPQETPLYIYGSGRPGKVLMVLGGVHGNEPGGWLAGDRLQTSFRPAQGAFLIIPRANRLATIAFDRTGGQGDLNRLYPGDHDGSQ